MVSSVFQRALLASALAGWMSLTVLTPANADEAQEVSKLIQSNQLDEALQRVDASLAQKPRDAQMRFFKGLILTEQGKSSDAIPVFQHLTEDYPELPEPYNNLAVLYASQGEFEKARASLEMAIRTHPSYATAHENLGDVYAKLASQAYDKALQLDSTNTVAQSKLALIRELISVNGAPSKKPSGTSGPVPSPGVSLPPNKNVAAAKTAPQAPPVAPAVALAASPAPTGTTLPPATPSAAPAPTPAPKIASAAPAPTPPAASAAAAPPTTMTMTKTPAPSSPPAPALVAEPASSPASPEQAEVSSAVDSWAKAWASKDVASYLASYAKDFATPSGESRQQWEDDRRARIVGKSSISVKLEDIQISVQGDHAVVHFRQDYHADHLSANSRKTLTLEKSSGKWLIQQERTGA